MDNIRKTLVLVFSSRIYYLIAGLSGILIALFYLFVGQVIVFFPEGIYIEPSPLRLGTIGILSVLFGLVAALTVYNFRLRRLSAKGGGAGFGGSLAGLLTCGCCAPVLPGILVLFGFTGTSLLSINTALQLYIIPLSILGIAVMFLSLKMMAKSISGKCEINK